MGEVSRWTISVPSLAILVSSVLVLSCGQTDRQTESQTERTTEADDRYTHATTVGMYMCICLLYVYKNRVKFSITV